MPERGIRKSRTGVVISDKMDKTIVVEIVRKTKHPLYGKTITRSNRFKVHDEENKAKVGDKVLITETRPISKDKRWRLVEVVEAAK
jgi:small subunit ribosomal protein S17